MFLFQTETANIYSFTLKQVLGDPVDIQLKESYCCLASTAALIKPSCYREQNDRSGLNG